MTKRAAARPTDIGSLLPQLATMAANKVRTRKTPLTWSEALAAAPWDAKTMPPAWEEPTRRAFAMRLVERGLATPAKAGGASGTAGYATKLDRCLLSQSREEFDAQKALAKAAGLSWSTWARRKLAQ